jgi:hypothetical protein
MKMVRFDARHCSALNLTTFISSILSIVLVLAIVAKRVFADLPPNGTDLRDATHRVN